MKINWILTVFVSLSTMAQTQETNKLPVKNKSLEVTSQQLEYDHINHKAVFIRKVKAINGNTTITAQKMTCFFDNNNDPYLILAAGKVVIVKGKNRAKAEKAIYKLKKQIIILKDNPELFDGNNTIKARIITFNEASKINDFDEPECLLIKHDKQKK